LNHPEKLWPLPESNVEPNQTQIAAISAAIQAYLEGEIRPPIRNTLVLSPWKITSIVSAPLMFTRKSLGWNGKTTYNN